MSTPEQALPSLQAPARFALSQRWRLREGCGYGVHQSHAVGALQWRAHGDAFDARWVGHLQALLDESIARPPSRPEVQGLARWVAGTLGALLRSAGIATVRDVYLEPMRTDDPRVQRCLMVIPVASGKASMIALQWLLSCLNDPPGHEQRIQARFFELQDALRPFARRSSNHWRTLQAAYDERYPVLPVTTGIACIGTGMHRRWFDSFITDRTPHLAMQLAQDKQRTARLLRAHGFPGSVNRLVETLQQARDAAREFGYPVVVKPNDRDRGLGVSAGVASVADLVAAYELATQHSRRVLVEKFQPGFTHRFSVVEGRVLRVARHVAFGVTGDGRSSIEQLVAAQAQTLEEQKRTRRLGAALCVLDEEALGLLSQNGLGSQHVPRAGEHVRLRRKDNVSAGGRRITLNLDEVHPDNLRLAVNVSALLGLDFAGVDLISPDVSRSWRDGAVTICEINGNPQLVARDDPDMYKRVLRHVMPAPFRVEAVLVLLMSAPDETGRDGLVQRYSSPSSGDGLSLACGIWLDGAFVSGPFANGYAAAVALCTNARARKLTFAMTVEEVLRHGVALGEIDAVLLPARQASHVAAFRQRDYRMALSLLRAHTREFSFPGEAA